MDFPPVPYSLSFSETRVLLVVKYSLYITTGKVTTLGHEICNNPVELGPFVAKTLLMGTKGSEILSSPGDYLIVELKVHTAPLLFD